MLSTLLDLASVCRDKWERYRLEHRWRKLRELGMHLGKDVWLPASTWIDTGFCHLISIGDHCGFGEQCLILAHDAQMDEFIDAARIGRVIIHPSCHVGARTVILPGVELGPRTIVGSNSVVSRTLPPDTVCVGNPAKVICTLDEYLQKHRSRLATHPTFPYQDSYPLPEQREQLAAAVRSHDGYIVGGRSAELSGKGGTQRTSV